MIIKSLKLKNFRNYNLLNLEFDSATNIFYGDNAQGKTNILESIYLGSTTKSHRGTKDRDIIKFEEEESHIELIIDKKGVPFQIDMHLKKNAPKGIAINKHSIRKASELCGIVNIVFFSPEDLNIIKNGPAERRRFMDAELAQIDKIYLNNLLNYNRIVNQRNKLLKNGKSKDEIEETLDIWDKQLVTYGNLLIDRRKIFIDLVNKIISNVHKKLTGNKEDIILKYESGLGSLDFKQALQKNRARDLKFKSTSCGPHRDDIGFFINGLDIRKFGSQGQQRTTALSLKLSEIDLVKQITGDKPILLLDDVLSELDKSRQNYLLDSIDGIQTLITCTGVEEFVKHRFSINKIFHVENGMARNEN